MLMSPQGGQGAPAGRVCSGLAFAALLAALVWAPWPLGSNRPWALATLALLVWAGLVLAAVAAAWPGRSMRAGWWRGSAWALGLGAGFCALVAAQAAWGSLEGELLLTHDPFATRHYLLRALTFVGAIGLVVLTVDTAKRVQWVLGTVFAAGLAQAVVAVLLYSSGASYDYLFTDFRQGGRATGTFANPDHLAGYMELTLAAGLGLLVRQFGGDGRGGHGWRGRVTEGLSFLMSRKMLLRLALVVPVVVLVMTHSRMGNAAFFLSLLLVGALVAALSRRLRRPALWLVASMAVVDIFIVGQWVGLERVVERMKDTAEASSERLATFGLLGTPPPPREQSLAQRLEIPRLSLALVQDRPWFGHGGGSYSLAFAPHKPDTVYAGLWSHAHNDYVQVAVDTGLVGLALWAGLGIAVTFGAWPLLRDGQSRLNRGVAVAALMAVSCLGLHGMVDFNLDIPANALTFAVLLGLVGVVRALPAQRGAPDSR
jgi:O-antigen ligase